MLGRGADRVNGRENGCEFVTLETCPTKTPALQANLFRAGSTLEAIFPLLAQWLRQTKAFTYLLCSPNLSFRELRKWWAQYMESTSEMETALQFYEAARDNLSLVRVYCYCGNLEKVQKHLLWSKSVLRISEQFSFGPGNWSQLLNQWNAKLKPITSWSLAFFRASSRLPVFALSSHWLMMMSTLVLRTLL